MSVDEKRFNELNRRAYDKHYTEYTEFLNLDEQSILANTYLPYETFGGYDNAQRVVVAFGEVINESDYPIVCIEIKPTAMKFADKLTHRDFLGALMNLGIRRELLGDIIIEDNCGYLFCLGHIAEYICDNLSRIKHTTVLPKIIKAPTLVSVLPNEQEMVVASLRADVLVATVYKLSRREASLLFQQGKIYVNNRQTTNSSYIAKEEDIFSVRGFGRFQFVSSLRKTKKDRTVVSIRVYK